MADLMRWNPGLRRLQDEMEQWFGPLSVGFPEDITHGGWPKADIYEDQEGLRLSFEIPGMDPKDVRVSLTENTLTVSGQRKLENEDKRTNYRRIERSYGSFERSFSLPTNLDGEKIQAKYQSGVLQIHIPKSEKAKPRNISVKVES
jgi:HSP20 family protein